LTLLPTVSIQDRVSAGQDTPAKQACISMETKNSELDTEFSGDSDDFPPQSSGKCALELNIYIFSGGRYVEKVRMKKEFVGTEIKNHKG